MNTSPAKVGPAFASEPLSSYSINTVQPSRAAVKNEFGNIASHLAVAAEIPTPS